MITIFTANDCSWCVKAKALLSERGLTWDEKNVSTDANLKEWRKLKVRTVPQVIIDGFLVGGYTELVAYFKHYDEHPKIVAKLEKKK